MGKTTVGVRLMADLTSGILRGEFQDHPQNVLIVAAEDGLEAVMRPRLEQAGADLERVWFVKARLDPGQLAQDVVLPVTCACSAPRSAITELAWSGSTHW